jgi:hypothetical protein
MYYKIIVFLLYAGINLCSNSPEIKFAQAAQTAASTKQSFVETKENVKTLRHVLKDSLDTWMPDSLQNIIAQYEQSFDCILMCKIDEPDLIPSSFKNKLRQRYSIPTAANEFTIYIDEEKRQFKVVTFCHEWVDKSKQYSYLKKWNCISGEIISCDKVYPSDDKQGQYNRFSSEGNYVAFMPDFRPHQMLPLQNLLPENNDRHLVSLPIHVFSTLNAVSLNFEHMVLIHDYQAISFLNKENKTYRYNMKFNLWSIFSEKQKKELKIETELKILPVIAISKHVAILLAIPKKNQLQVLFTRPVITAEDRERGAVLSQPFVVKNNPEHYKMYFSHNNKYLNIYPQWHGLQTSLYYQLDLSTGMVEEKKEKFHIGYSVYSRDGRYRAIEDKNNVFLINTATNTCRKIEISEALYNNDSLSVDQLVFSQTGKYLGVSVLRKTKDKEVHNKPAVYIFRILDDKNEFLEDAEIIACKKNEHDLQVNKNNLITSLTLFPESAREVIASYADTKIIISPEFDLAELPDPTDLFGVRQPSFEDRERALAELFRKELEKGTIVACPK